MIVSALTVVEEGYVPVQGPGSACGHPAKVPSHNEPAMSKAINDALVQVKRRAERVEATRLVATFVEAGSLFTLLSSTDHQVIYGRRGTGKTHALKYLGEDVLDKGDHSIYIDMRTIGSNGGLYTDTSIPVTERGTRLLVDTLVAIHDGLIDLALERGEQDFEMGASYELLDQLGNAISEVRVSGPVEQESTTAAERIDEQTLGLELRATSIPLSVNAGATSRAARREELRVRETGTVEHRVHFGSLTRLLTRTLEALPVGRVWVLLDEWSEVPLDLQPLLADLIRRCILPVLEITVKIGAIEQRSRFRVRRPTGDFLGFEIGADVAADVNLDDFMVFGNDRDRAKAFFKELFFKHIQAVMAEGSTSEETPKDSGEFVRRAFTQQTALSELVRAAEGVPRDAINVAMLAAMKAGSDPIGVPHVRRAAQDWYQRDKGRAIEANPQASALLHWIIDEVIGERQARGFLLLPVEANHPLIRELYDARILHIIKRGYSAQDEPGVRYDVFQIDYGCYVDLIATGTRAPLGLFEVETTEGSEFVDVPADDYRSIRRAILRIDDFENAQTVASATGAE